MNGLEINYDVLLGTAGYWFATQVRPVVLTWSNTQSKGVQFLFAALFGDWGSAKNAPAPAGQVGHFPNNEEGLPHE